MNTVIAPWLDEFDPDTTTFQESFPPVNTFNVFHLQVTRGWMTNGRPANRAFQVITKEGKGDLQILIPLLTDESVGIWDDQAFWLLPELVGADFMGRLIELLDPAVLADVLSDMEEFIQEQWEKEKELNRVADKLI